MAETDSLHNSRIKNFEQKIINQSMLDVLCYDRLADYLLECCHAEAKPNTLSLFSCLPLLLLALFVDGPSPLAFFLTILCIFTHQLLDIANKKQAFRLQRFSLNTFYVDHLFDSLSGLCLVFVVAKLLELPPGAVLTSVYFFGMLPFYTHHLAMYCNDYMTFPKLSPTTQGLVVTKLLLLVGAIFPSFFAAEVVAGVSVAHIYIGAASLWLLVFVLHDLYTIVMGKRVTDAKSSSEEHMPLKNLFVVFLMGYLVLEVTSIEWTMLEDPLFLRLAFFTLAVFFVHLIGNLVLSYGYCQAFKQISLPLLLGIGSLVTYYAILVFTLRNSDSYLLLSKISLGTILAVFSLALIRETYINLLHIKSVLSSE